ncbi:MAG: hypothetical protein QG670_2582 [Thermoproteota archaeon]|nr:hypothetical protein [Thermoproteota archaeon]
MASEGSLMTKDTQKVRFLFKKSDDYKSHFINGVYGGLSTHGDVICNFFFEARELPSEELGTIDNGNLILSPPPEAKTIEILRELKVGIIVSPKEARDIANWILSKADEADSARKETH